MELSKWKMDKIEKHLEECGRNCYKSEDRITDTSAPKFVEKICRRHHLSVLEHEGLTARITCSRACSHQLVRHRIASYSQESMRYCNYGKRGLQVICPPSIGVPPGRYEEFGLGSHGMNQVQIDWLCCVIMCYEEYLRELDNGVRPEDARFVLPHATKTCVVATYNMSMWRHVIEERGLNTHAQWEIRKIFHGIYEDLREKIPSIFGDLQ